MLVVQNSSLKESGVKKSTLGKVQIQEKSQIVSDDPIENKDLNFTKENFARKTLGKSEKFSENEKAMQKTIETLNNRVSDLMKETEKYEKQLNNWKENYQKLDKEHKNLLSKPISKTNADIESSKKIAGVTKIEGIQELRDKIFDLENKISQLEKVIQIEKEPLIKKLKQDKEKLEEDAKQIKVCLIIYFHFDFIYFYQG